MKPIITFDEKKHAYTINGKKAVSVTTLMKAIGIGKNYDNAKDSVMEAARQRGNYYDELVEEAIMKPFELTEWQERFLKAIEKEGLQFTSTQELVGTEKPFPIGGKPDLVGNLILADFKATYEIYLNSVTWQTNIYTYLRDYENYDKYRLFVIHFSEKDSRFTIKELERIPKENIEKAFECYQLGDNYAEVISKEKEIVDIREFSEAFDKVKAFDKRLKEEQKKLKSLYGKIEKEMGENNIKKLELENFNITYTPPTKKRKVDLEAIIRRHKEVFLGLKEILRKRDIFVEDKEIVKELKENPIDPKLLELSDKTKEKYTSYTNVKAKLTVTEKVKKDPKEVEEILKLEQKE